jgi:hypothetical protein
MLGARMMLIVIAAENSVLIPYWCVYTLIVGNSLDCCRVSLTDGESKTFYLGSELAVFYGDAGGFVNLMEISRI